MFDWYVDRIICEFLRLSVKIFDYFIKLLFYIFSTFWFSTSVNCESLDTDFELNNQLYSFSRFSDWHIDLKLSLCEFLSALYPLCLDIYLRLWFYDSINSLRDVEIPFLKISIAYLGLFLWVCASVLIHLYVLKFKVFFKSLIFMVFLSFGF